MKATALRYDKSKNAAPYVAAKGRGAAAEKIIKIARENNIPIVDNKPLADILDKLDIYEEIPVELYKAIAQIFAFIYKMNNKILENKSVSGNKPV